MKVFIAILISVELLKVIVTLTQGREIGERLTVLHFVAIVYVIRYINTNNAEDEKIKKFVLERGYDNRFFQGTTLEYVTINTKKIPRAENETFMQRKFVFRKT